MLIRNCEKEDLEKVMEIERTSFDYPYSREIFEDNLNSDFFIVAEEDSTVIGYILGEEREDEGVIVSLAVSPDHRLQGVGTSLMKKVQRKMDVNRYFLIVRDSNREAQIFYDRLGFSKITKIKDYYQNDEDGILMQKAGKEEN